jgi:biotin carboxyl carrier protein
MKLRIKLQAASQTQEHLLELPLSAVTAEARQGRLPFALDGQSREVDWAEISSGVYSILIGGRSYDVHVRRLAVESSAQSSPYNVAVGNRHYRLELQDARLRRYRGGALGPEGPQEILSPMPGRIVKILVSEKQQVEGGKGLLVIEAMKMQNELRAPRSGCIEKIYVREGIGVEAGFKLLRLV